MDVSSHNILQLLLLKSPFQNKSMWSVDAAIRSQLSKEIVLEMIQRTVKTGCLVVDVGEDGSLGSFSKYKWWWEGDFLAETEGGIVLTKDSEYPMQ